MSHLPSAVAMRVPDAAKTAPLDLERVPCLLCGSGEHRPVIAAGDRVTRQGGLFQVVCCRSCGLHFTNPRPTSAQIGRFYPDDYAPWAERVSHGAAKAVVRRRLEGAVLRIDFGHPPQPPRPSDRLLARVGRAWIRRGSQRQTWIPFSPPGRLLDFGCGRGDFLVAMRNYGWTVEGMDVSAAAARSVEDLTGIRVHAGTLPHPDLKPGAFDAVSMWNALEHVHWPRTIVRAARDLLRPGGLLVIGVPNIDSWSFRQFGPNWWQLELPRHLVHFTPPTLSSLLAWEGFHVRQIDQIGRPGWLRKSARTASRAGYRSWMVRLLKKKWPALTISRWSERTGQADFIRVIAERAK